MNKIWISVFIALVIVSVGMAGAANYMYEKAAIRGVGYVDGERIISTQYGYSGAKLVEKTSGSGNVITDNWELEAERQLNHDGSVIGNATCKWPTGDPAMDYINFTRMRSSSTCLSPIRPGSMIRSGSRSYAFRTIGSGQFLPRCTPMQSTSR